MTAEPLPVFSETTLLVRDGAGPALAIQTHWAALDVDEAETARLAALLAPEEIERASRYRRPLDRARYVVRRGALRELLGARLACPPRRVRLSQDDHGRPLVEGDDLDFNLSHAGGLAFYAIAQGARIGCDLEWEDASLATREIAERFFSPRERADLEALAPCERTRAFFNAWTRKEAFVKALGLGLSFPLDAFDVSLAPGEPAALLAGPRGWTLRAFEPQPGLHVALAFRARIGGHA